MAVRAKKDLCTGPLLSGMLLYTLPVMATGILQVLYNTADTFVVALSAAGDTAVAAISSTAAVTALFVNLFNGLCSGVLTAVARHIGARNEQNVHKSVHTRYECGTDLRSAVDGDRGCRVPTSASAHGNR